MYFTPKMLELKTDTDYFYCTCGKSKDGLFCDGAHRGTAFKPNVFRVQKNDTYTICRCKKSNNQPFCDGSHQQ